MKVILQRTIPHIGDQGDIKEVKDGYARNYLLPHGHAVIATAASITTHERIRQQALTHATHERARQQTLAGHIRSLTLIKKVSTTPLGHLYGGIHKEDIVQMLKERGIIIEAQAVQFTAPLKTIGSHRVEIRLKFGILTSFTLQLIPA